MVTHLYNFGSVTGGGIYKDRKDIRDAVKG